MATAIRLKRGGRTHSAYYRIVVMDSRTRDQGREVEILGFHHPAARPEPVSQVDAHKTLEWLRKGAQPSDTVRSLLRRIGLDPNPGKRPALPVEPAAQPAAQTPA